MNSELIVAILACVGTLIGSFGGIMASNRLTVYRIQKLEEKVDKHNCVIQRTFILEEKMSVANHRIDDLEDGRCP